MRISFSLSSVAVIIALAASCDKRELKVIDRSEPESISITFSDTSLFWKTGTTRTVAIECEPDYARIGEYGLTSSDEGIFDIRPGTEPNVFEVTAAREGAATITASADGLTAGKRFSVYDDSIKKEDLEVRMHIKDIYGQESADDFPEKAVLDAMGTFHLTVSSICNAPTYRLESFDKDIISLEWSGNGSWIINTLRPGRCDMRLTVTDDNSNVFEYEYNVIVYGHINFIAACHPLDGTAGFAFEEHPYDITTADIYLSGTVSGYPWNDKEKTVYRHISPVSGSYDLSSGTDYTSIIDASEAFSEINSMYEMDGNEKIWYGVHNVRLDFIIRLDNPYIIIDDVLDDSDTEDPEYYNFETSATFRQEGLAAFTETGRNRQD